MVFLRLAAASVLSLAAIGVVRAQDPFLSDLRFPDCAVSLYGQSSRLGSHD